MAYTAIGVKNPKFNEKSTLTTLAKSGENLRDLPQFLDINYAQKIENYLIKSDGGLEKRKGLLKFFEVAGSNPITMLEKFTDDILIFGYGTTVAAYTISTDTITNIKTDFSANNGFNGVRYGEYFFVCNGVEKIYRISRTLDYDAQTVNFTAGNKIAGGTSGATAVILEDNDAGTSGTLTLGNISGTFENNEVITETVPPNGSATVDGTLGFTATEVTASPICSVLYVFGSRLVAGNLSTNSTAVQYSEVDDGSNPPFDTWSDSSTADDGGTVYWRNAGTVNDITQIGNILLVFAENGKWGFTIDQIDSNNIIQKIDKQVFNREDFGGNRAISTSKGVFYVNEAGLWQLISVGQPDIPYSDQEVPVSELLGRDYFADLDMTDADLVYDENSRVVFVTCRKSSSQNNYVFGYSLDFKAFFRVTGWNIRRFLKTDDFIYGGNSVNGKVYKCFTGSDDDGFPIGTTYEQEINVGGLWTRKDLLGLYAQAQLSRSSTLDFVFDIYNKNGVKTTNKCSFTMRTQYNLDGSDGYGTAEYSGSSYGGDKDSGSLISSFDGIRPFIRNWQRIIMRVTGQDKLPHKLEWVGIQTREKANIRRRKMTKNC